MRFDPCKIPDSPFNSLEDTSATAGLSKLEKNSFPMVNEAR